VDMRDESIIPIRGIIDAMMLSLRRRYLERHLDGPYNDSVSRELDAAVSEQERIIEDHHTTTKGAGDEDR
jgi:hypothetical protein